MKKINWSYIHSFGKSKVRKTKTGRYLGLIDHTKRHWLRYNSVQMALVQFEGNKRCSRVPYHELEFIED